MTEESATASVNAMAYWLLASTDNFGSGWGDTEDDRWLQEERRTVSDVIDRLTKTRQQYERPT